MVNRDLEKTRVEQIVSLHNQVIADLKRSLESAIQIGGLLAEQKKNLKHGQFGTWIEANLPFTDRTARNYMRVYREKDRLKTETVSDLKSAYRLLSEPEINKDTMEMLSDLRNTLNTDYFEATPIGLITKREPTKAEWMDYGYRLVALDEFLKENNFTYTSFASGKK